MTDKVLFIDAQVFQSDAWDRGMGKYSLELLKSIIESRHNSYKRVCLIFTKRRPLSGVAQDKLDRIAPNAEQLFLDLVVPTDEQLSGITQADERNKETLDEAISPILGRRTIGHFLILALFTDHSFSTFPSKTHNVLLGYDLIPLLYSDRYIRHPNFGTYLARYEVIFRSDRILAISQTVVDDFVVYLGMSKQKVWNIAGGPVDRSSNSPLKPQSIQENTPFILMTSGDDLRKNNHRAVEGFAEYCAKQRNKTLQLVLISNYTDKTKSELRQISDQIVFAGNVSDDELKWLYKNAQCVLFASEYEGLGLPILEAAEAGKPVVCSRISAFKEMSDEAFYFADPLDVRSIASGLQEALNHEGWEYKRGLYPAILKKYSWKETARRSLEVLNTLSTKKTVQKKKKIAVLCPDPSGYSAIGKVVMETHAALAEKFEVDYYTERAVSEYADRLNRASFLDKVAPVYDAREFDVHRYKQYDFVYYHIGNSEYHVETIKNALHLPGIAIIHDTDLEGVLGILHLKGYVPAERLHAEHRLNDLNQDKRTRYLTSVVAAQRAVLVHSTYSQKAIKTITEAPVFRANLPTSTPKMMPDKNNVLTVGVAGILHPFKGTGLLDGLVTNPALKDCHFSMFGFSMLSSKDMKRFQRYDNLTIKTDLTDYEFQKMFKELSVLVNYRAVYRGETSLTILEAMRHGVVPVVRDVGWFSELPSDCVIKIKHEDELVDALSSLIHEGLGERSLRCKQYIEDNFSHEEYVSTMSRVQDTLTMGGRRSLNERIAKVAKKGLSKDRILKLIWRYGKS